MSKVDENATYRIRIDQFVFDIPLSVIANHHANEHKQEYGGDVGLTLREYTYPLFNCDRKEIEEWAKGNMSWEDVKAHVVLVELVNPQNLLQEGWMNGSVEVIPKQGAAQDT